MRRIAPLFAVLPAVLLGTTLTSAQVAHSKSGTIQFGSKLKGKSLQHVGSKFKKGKSIAWMARPKGNAQKFTFEVIQESGPGPHPATVWKQTVSSSKGTLTKAQLKRHKIKAAKFEVELFAGSKTVAKGKFEIQKPSGGSGGTY